VRCVMPSLLLLLVSTAFAADPWQELTSASALPPADAESAIEQLLRTHPGFHAARFNLGTLLLAQDAARAAEQLQLATAADDATLAADAWHNLALARWKLGQLDNALVAADEAAKRNPTYATLRDELRRVALIRADEARLKAEAAAKKLALAATRLPEARVGEPYRATVVIRGGTPPYHVALPTPPAPATAAKPGDITIAVPPLPTDPSVSNATPGPNGAPAPISLPPVVVPDVAAPSPLPPGLTLAADGTLSGKPTTPGTFRVPVVITDAANGSATGTIELVVVPQPAIATEALPEAVVGLPYTATLGSVGLRQPTWSATNLPAGLTCTADGVIRGLPTTTGMSSVVVRAADVFVPPLMAHQAERKLDLAVVDTFAPDVNPLPPATAGQPYTHRLGVRGPPQAYRWAAADGQLTVAEDGTVQGTPAAAGTVSRPATIHAADRRSRDVSLSLPVNPRPLITTGEPLRLQAGQPVDQPLPVTGGTPPLVWSTGDGALPAGVRLDADGHLRGVAKDPGTATVTAIVTDKWQARTQAAVVVQVDPAPKQDDKKDDKQDSKDDKKDQKQDGQQQAGQDPKSGDQQPGDQKPGDQKSEDQKQGDQSQANQSQANQKPDAKPGDDQKGPPKDQAKSDGKAEDKSEDKADGKKSSGDAQAGKDGEAAASEAAGTLNQMAADRWLDHLPAENRGVLRYQLLDGGEKRPAAPTGKTW